MRKKWKEIHLICIRVKEKKKNKVRKRLMDGFSPIVVAAFYTDYLGWEVNR